VRGDLGLERRGPPGEDVRAALAGAVDEDAAQVAGRQVRGEEAPTVDDGAQVPGDGPAQGQGVKTTCTQMLPHTNNLGD
jgi:hypothetical protein